MKRPATDREKICTKYISDKKLVSINRIYKLSKLSSAKTNSPIRKWTNHMKRNFIKEDIQMGNEYMKRCSALLEIRKMKTETMISIHVYQNG